MSKLALPLRITYRCTLDASRAQSEMIQGKSSWRWWEILGWGELTRWVIVSLMALYLSARSNMGFFFAVFMADALWTGRNMLHRWHQWKHTHEQSLLVGTNKTISLEITEGGLVEHDSGVESFCPWMSMEKYGVIRGTLCIALKNGLWAVIPVETLEPDKNVFDSIVALLKEKGVPRKDQPTH